MQSYQHTLKHCFTSCVEGRHNMSMIYVSKNTTDTIDIQILAPPLISCMTLVKSLDFSVPQVAIW